MPDRWRDRRQRDAERARELVRPARLRLREIQRAVLGVARGEVRRLRELRELALGRRAAVPLLEPRLSGTRGEQIAGRFGIVRTGPSGTGQQRTALIAALEDSLRLHRHQPGTLPGLDRDLHQRSHGMIGSLLWLIRSAAISAVLDGTEKITRKALDAVEADITSQSPRPPAT